MIPCSTSVKVSGRWTSPGRLSEAPGSQNRYVSFSVQIPDRSIELRHSSAVGIGRGATVIPQMIFIRKPFPS